MECFKYFNENICYFSHLKVFQGMMEIDKFKCTQKEPECFKEFLSFKNFKEHLKNHTQNNENVSKKAYNLETSSTISKQCIVFDDENDKQNWSNDHNFSEENIIFENPSEDNVNIDESSFLMFQSQITSVCQSISLELHSTKSFCRKDVLLIQQKI